MTVLTFSQPVPPVMPNLSQDRWDMAETLDSLGHWLLLLPWLLGPVILGAARVITGG